MSFLAPAFFLGLGAIAVPILIHLIQRERKRVVMFPSLMFLQRIPYQSVRRRRIRHWFLLAMRVAAIALIVLAFARPFFRQGDLAAAAIAGAREVVILLDQSASMGYGDHWQRARDAVDVKRKVGYLPGQEMDDYLVPGHRYFSEAVRELARKRINPLKVMIDGAHAMGIKVHVGVRPALPPLDRAGLQRRPQQRRLPANHHR